VVFVIFKIKSAITISDNFFAHNFPGSVKRWFFCFKTKKCKNYCR